MPVGEGRGPVGMGFGRGSRSSWGICGGSASQRRLAVGLRIRSPIRNWSLANRQKKYRSSEGKHCADQAFRRNKTELRMKPLNEDAIQ